VKKIVPSLIEEGFYVHPWIGFRGDDVTVEIAQAMGLTEARGALVVDVIAGTPASRAGLQEGNTDFTGRDGPTSIGGDVIIAVEGESIYTFNDVISYLSRKGEVGQTIVLTIIREGEEVDIDLTLEARPTPSRFSSP
jgi:2-alkenal reductase